MVQISMGMLAYFGDSKTRAAVDLLLAKKRPSIPDDVEWDEVPEFFRALRAARQIQTDYAILLHEIWNDVWKPLPATIWKAKAPYEQGDDGILDPTTIWTNSYALRLYERDKLSSELIVYVDNETGVQIGFNVTQNGKTKLPKLLADWEADDGTFWSPSALVKIQKNLNLTALEPWAVEATKIIKSAGKAQR